MFLYKWIGLFLAAALSLHAYIIDSKYATPDRLYIQVGALSRMESVNEVVKKLHRFPLLVEKNGDIVRVYVVSNPKYRKAMFRKVRKLIPDAFIRKNRIVLQTPSPLIYKNVDSVDDTKNETNFTLPLNAQTILKTRKKFF